MRLSKRLAIVAVLLCLLVLGHVLRGAIAVEATSESVRRFMASLGWWGPVVFVGLFTLRTILLLPSVVLLAAGGICFGFAGGTLLGGLGLFFSALLKFGLAEVVGREWVLDRLSERNRTRLDVLQGRGGAGILGLATAYPVGPAEVLQVAAILAGMRAAPFFVSITAGAFVRAASLSLFGEAVIQGRGLVLAAIVLLAGATLPLLVPGVRRTLLSIR